MTRKLNIWGDHPIKASLLDWFTARGYEVTASADLVLPDKVEADDIVILSADDTQAMNFLSGLAALPVSNASGARPAVHLLLKGNTLLGVLRASDFPKALNQAFDVYPFTMEDTWAWNMIVRLPGEESAIKPLDRESVAPGSDKFVHLVIAGFDTYATALAVKAALSCHFPNYNPKDRFPLRTRITFIQPSASEYSSQFIKTYRSLFDNSFYREVSVKDRKAVLHRPQFFGEREDFVDVEWEFVDADISDTDIVTRLARWADDPRRILTIALSDSSDKVNLDACLALPEVIFDKGIPVWIRQKDSLLTDSLRQAPKYSAVVPFGMETSGYNPALPEMKLARLVNYVYSYYCKEGKLPTEIPVAEAEKLWKEIASYKIRMSNVSNVMLMAVKMRSAEHSDIEDLSRAEHNRWSVERLLSGSRPCTDEQREAIRNDISLKKKFKVEKDIHYDLCSYDELGTDENGNDVRIYDKNLTACIPLMVDTYLKMTENEQVGR